MIDELAPGPGESGMDYPEHENTYLMFLGILKWGAVAAVLVVALLAFVSL